MDSVGIDQVEPIGLDLPLAQRRRPGTAGRRDVNVPVAGFEVEELVDEVVLKALLDVHVAEGLVEPVEAGY